MLGVPGWIHVPNSFLGLTPHPRFSRASNCLAVRGSFQKFGAHTSRPGIARLNAHTVPALNITILLHWDNETTDLARSENSEMTTTSPSGTPLGKIRNHPFYPGRRRLEAQWKPSGELGDAPRSNPAECSSIGSRPSQQWNHPPGATPGTRSPARPGRARRSPLGKASSTHLGLGIQSCGAKLHPARSAPTGQQHRRIHLPGMPPWGGDWGSGP